MRQGCRRRRGRRIDHRHSILAEFVEQGEVLGDRVRAVADAEDLSRWLALHLKVFFSVDDWASAMRGYDFVYGTRFHGCLVALREGVPAVVICHDTRTSEIRDTEDISLDAT